MPKRSTVPAYCRPKASNRAYASMNGRSIYLGRYGSDESKIEYRRILHELEASPTRAVQSAPYPFERTLLTSGMVIGAVASLHAGQARYETKAMEVKCTAPP